MLYIAKEKFVKTVSQRMCRNYINKMNVINIRLTIPIVFVIPIIENT